MLGRQRETRHGRHLAIVICILLGVSLGVWHNRMLRQGRQDYVLSAVRTVTAPVVGALAGTGRWMSRQFGWLVRGRTLADENRRLEAANAQLSEQIALLREADVTARRLREQLGFRPPPTFTRRAANVIAVRPTPRLETIVIDVGSMHGVRVDSVVVSPRGIVGHVSTVGPTTSTVLLLTDAESAVGAMVQRASSRAMGVCKGDGGPLLSMTYLDRNADVKVGDLIVSSGLGGAKGVFPRGLVVGSVVDASEKVSGTGRQVRVRPAVRLDRLEEVYVLL